ncbi:hypothetical protein GEV39_19810 [Pseudomonas sp. NY5710]|nr:hypothetical protein GEV39_19810 [Pseudomonas sp. NY5710]
MGRKSLLSLCRPLRGQARSYRKTTVFKACDVPVGAGLPAKRPEQAENDYSSSTVPSARQ